MVTLCPLIPAIAHADGVVFESTIAKYKIGQIIAAGETIDLPAGEQIKILNRDGKQVPISGRVVYKAAENLASTRQAPSPFDIATWNKRRADIGATRGDMYDQCIEDAANDPALDASDCEQDPVDADRGPSFAIKNAALRSEIRPSQALRIEMVADFHAIAKCRMHPVDTPADGWVLDLGPNGNASARVVANTPKYIPQRGVTAPQAPAMPGEYIVTCLAISPSVFDLIGNTLGGIVKDADRDLFLMRFAELRGEPAAIGTLSLTVSGL
ncbi:MAG: hypothetical protein AAGH49_03450 [Pseudomonadota bacterium]